MNRQERRLAERVAGTLARSLAPGAPKSVRDRLVRRQMVESAGECPCGGSLTTDGPKADAAGGPTVDHRSSCELSIMSISTLADAAGYDLKDIA